MNLFNRTLKYFSASPHPPVEKALLCWDISIVVILVFMFYTIYTFYRYITYDEYYIGVEYSLAASDATTLSRLNVGLVGF